MATFYNATGASPHVPNYPATMSHSPYVASPQQYGASSSTRGIVGGGTQYSTQVSGALERGVSEIGERRRVKSVVLNEELLGPAPEESVRYVEVPYVEEVVRHVPRREVVEVEKRVPKYEYEWVERIVEVPQIQYVDKTIEVPQVHEVVRHVPRREVVEVPREIIRHVPKVETKIVDKVVEVPGEIIEVPKPYTVENKVAVPHHVDKEVPMIVAQTLRPVLTESEDFVDVEVVEYEPEVIPVDIHVPKAVQSQLVSVGVVEEQHRVVRVPAAQYNSMLRMLNPHIAESDSSALPYLSNVNGAVPFLGTSEIIPNIQPMAGVKIEGWQQQHASYKSRGASHSSGDEMAYRSVSGRTSQTGTQRSKSHYSKRDRGMTSTTITSATTSVHRNHHNGHHNGHHQRTTEKRMTKGEKKAKGTCPC